MSPGDELERTGRVWFRAAMDEAALQELADLCDVADAPGRRVALRSFQKLDAIAHDLLPGARPVRVVAFNKSASMNWSLAWHQDRVISVSERIESPGFVNWTRKSGVWHVEPPVKLLERMIFLRVHVDRSDTENGCLEIAPGSHRRGKVMDGDAEVVANVVGPEPCIAERGDVLAAKALILHRSRASRSAASRRAIRFDYSADDLTAPLKWVVTN